MKVPQAIALTALILACVAAGRFIAPSHVHVRTVQRDRVVWRGQPETIYVRNVATHYISDATIRKDLPAWQSAANHQLARYWHTAPVRLRFLGRKQAPKDSMVALFKQKGPISQALAFHEVLLGSPAIVVYAGTDNYYGYSNSVSFTHELFELLADPTISQTNQGYPYPYFYVGTNQFTQNPGTVWSNEVADPVEKYVWRLDGVPISDFVTPNWFNDHVTGPFDFMGVVQSPFVIAKGGYACFYTGQWECPQNFKDAGRDASGFFVGERGDR